MNIIITVLLLLGVLGTAAAVMISGVLRAKKREESFQSLIPFTGVEWVGAADAVALSLAVVKAREALVGVWSLEKMADALAQGTRIEVKDVDEWIGTAGVKVAGETSGVTVQVGKNLAALCHELAHLFENRIDGKVDDAHAGWTTNGIFAAIEVYAGWLSTK